MARLRDSWRSSLPVAQQPRNPQSESIARNRYQAIHLGHMGGLIRGCLVPLPYIRAVSLLVSGLSDLQVENVLLTVQIAQLLGQSRLIHGHKVPSRDQASLLCLA